MTTLLQTKNTTRFLDYYGDSNLTEIIKVNDIPIIIHNHKKFLQDIGPSNIGGN